jgi:hypothetical protein
MEFKKFSKKGQLGGVNLILPLILSVGVGVLVLIFTNSMSAITYNLVEPNINNISNTTIRDSAKDAIIYGFNTQKMTAQYLQLIVLAVIITIVIGLIVGLGGAGGGMGGRQVL